MKNRSLFIIMLSVALCICISVTAVLAFIDNGHFSSNTNAYINLRIDWDVEQGEGEDTASVTAKLYLDCYSIFVGARTNNKLSINNSVKTFDTPSITHTDNTAYSVLLTEYTIPVQRKPGTLVECKIDAEWTFNGIYGGKEIGKITASQKLIITDNGVVAEPSEVVIPETTVPDITDETTPTNETGKAENPSGGAEISKMLKFKSSESKYLNLACDIQISDSVETDGKITVVGTLYLEYYSLFISERSGSIFSIGDTTIVFTVPAINESSNTKHCIELGTISVECEEDDELAVSAVMPFNGVYAESKIDSLTISGIASVK